jgi:phage terminase large subunit-like protein
MAEAAGDWQRDLVAAVFGSYDPASNERHIRDFFCMVPKKSSKTTAGAAIMLTALLKNKRPNAEFLLIAPTLEIADLAYRQVVGMIEADPVLAKKFHVRDHIKRITYRPTKAFLKVKSFDPKVVTGSKPSGVLLDELHVIAASPEADRVIGQLKGGLLPNPEAFFITITTQSERPPAGVFKAALTTARRVRDGQISLPLLPVLYEFPEAVDWKDPANWHMVTPNNGRSITVERLISDFDEAKDKGDEELRRWASQHLNIEIGLALANDRWAGADYWEAAADKYLTLDEVLARSEVCTVGIDGGGLDDLFGLAVLGRCRETKHWLLWTHAWAHDDVLKRRNDIASRLMDFRRDGDLTISEDPMAPIMEAAAYIERVKEASLLPESEGVGIDPIGVAALVDELEARGIAPGQQVAIRQGFALSPASWGAEIKLKNGSLKHGGQRMMAWCVGNAKVEVRGGAVIITKQSAGRAKIDPLVAAFNAMMLMARKPQARVEPKFQMFFA